MGVGKTTIGRMLSRELGLEFIDSDHEVEDRAGAEIAWIFDVEGEAGFRERETRVLEDLCQRDRVLIATGGGAVLRPENRKILHRNGVVIFLDTSVDVQLKRTAKDKKRPLLQNTNRRETLTRMRRERDPSYKEVADVHVFVGENNSKRTVQKILKQLDKQGSKDTDCGDD
jgi:shikimate kinase